MFSFFYNAKAKIRGSKNFPNLKGIVYFKENSNSVLVTAKIEGLPQSKDTCLGRFFGMHIHEGSSWSWNVNDEFANVENHFNPAKCPHPFHVGDLPPLIENNGIAYMSVMVGKFKVSDIVVRTIIIHEMPDDFTTQPKGNSGKKIGCWVIEWFIKILYTFYTVNW